MTLNEFKAWLEGFEEAMGGNPPTAEQWASIKAKLAKVEIVRPAAYRDNPIINPEPWPKVRYGSGTEPRAVLAD